MRVLLICILVVVPTFAQQKPDAPKPVRHESRWKLDRSVLSLAGAQAGAEAFDGVTTRIMLDRGWTEHDPVGRTLLGPRPSWARMAPAGTAEAIGTAYLAEWMRRRRWGKFVWWMPQVGLTVWHVREGSHNLTLRNLYSHRSHGSCPERDCR